MINPFNGARMREGNYPFSESCGVIFIAPGNGIHRFPKKTGKNILGIDKQYIFFYFDNQRKRE